MRSRIAAEASWKNTHGHAWHRRLRRGDGSPHHPRRRSTASPTRCQVCRKDKSPRLLRHQGGQDSPAKIDLAIAAILAHSRASVSAPKKRSPAFPLVTCSEIDCNTKQYRQGRCRTALPAMPPRSKQPTGISKGRYHSGARRIDPPAPDRAVHNRSSEA